MAAQLQHGARPRTARKRAPALSTTAGIARALPARTAAPALSRRTAPADGLSIALRHAVLARGAGAALPQRAQRALLQRDIGFEYEVNHRTYQAPRALSKPERQSQGAPTTQLPKGSTLVRGMGAVNGVGALDAKTDEAIGGGSNLEFEIAHQPENDGGRARLVTALDALERFCALLEAEPRAGRYHVAAAKFGAALGGAVPTPNRYIYSLRGATHGTPQATVGIRLDRIDEFMQNTIGGPNPQTPGARRELGAMVPTHFTFVGAAPHTVRTAIGDYVPHAGVATPEGFPSRALVGLCAIMLTYVRFGAAGAQTYAKGLAPLLAKTDLAHIFEEGVPAAERTFFDGEAGVLRFLAMWERILAAADVAGGLDGPVIRLDPMEGQGMEVAAALTRRRWLTELVAAPHTDLLTPANIPAVAAAGGLTELQAAYLRGSHGDAEAVAGAAITAQRAERLTAYRRDSMAGFGNLGARHDTVGPGAAANAPIFEMRRIERMGVHDFTEMALGVFDYVRALNAPAAAEHPPAYRRTTRPIRTPSLWQRFRFFWA